MLRKENRGSQTKIWHYFNYMGPFYLWVVQRANESFGRLYGRKVLGSIAELQHVKANSHAAEAETKVAEKSLDYISV